MNKPKIKSWIQQAGTLLNSLRFSSLDSDTREYVRNEQYYFNNRRIPVTAGIALFAEIINIIHVIFLSGSGLGTWNNLGYFLMYVILLIIAVLCLLLRRMLRSRQAVLSNFYIGCALLWGVWNAVLTVMDLRHNPNIVVYITAMLALSLLMRLIPVESLCTHLLSLGILLLFGWQDMSKGIIINLFIVTVISFFICCSRYVSSIEEIHYRQKLISQTNHSFEERQKIDLLHQQTEAFLTLSGEKMFIWNRGQERLEMTDGWHATEEEQKQLCLWLEDCGRDMALMGQQGKWQYLGDDSAAGRFRIFFLFDSNEEITGAVGCLCASPPITAASKA